MIKIAVADIAAAMAAQPLLQYRETLFSAGVLVTLAGREYLFLPAETYEFFATTYGWQFSTHG